MAALELINKVSLDLEEQINDLELIIRVCDSLAGDNPPEWLSLMFARVIDISASSRAYMETVGLHALPLLRDMAAVTR